MTGKQVTVIATIHSKPGMEGRVLEELLKLLGPTRAEKGCLNYDLHQSIQNPAEFVFHENWASEEDLVAHLTAPHLQAWRTASAPLLAHPTEVTRWKRVG